MELASPDQIKAFFGKAPLSPYDQWVLAFHVRRWAFLVAVTRSLYQDKTAPRRILDIGSSLQTDLLRHAFHDVPVDTLGITGSGRPNTGTSTDYTYDLNLLQNDPATWPVRHRYDLIVVAEVIEHLLIPPDVCLRGIADSLNVGGFVVLQTPNAAALHKRIQLLVGINPFMTLRGPTDNPPHFREYTRPELRRAITASGLLVHSQFAANYFTRNTLVSSAYNTLAAMLPSAFRAGLTLVAKKP